MSTYPVLSNPYFNLTTIDSITDNSIENIIDRWSGFCNTTQILLQGDLSVGSEFISHVQILCENRLASLVQDHFFKSLEETFAKIGANKFWAHFDDYSHTSELDESNIQKDCVEQVLCKALEDICIEKQYQEKCLLMLVHGLQLYAESMSEGRQSSNAERACLFSRYHLMVSSVLMTTLPCHFPEILRFYFKERLEELSTMMTENHEDVNKYQADDEMDIDERTKGSSRVGQMDIIDETHHRSRLLENNKLVKSIGKVVLDLRSLGFTSLTEDAYASSIFLVLKAKVHDLAGDDYRSSVLESIEGWIRVDALKLIHICSKDSFSCRGRNRIAGAVMSGFCGYLISQCCPSAVKVMLSGEVLCYLMRLPLCLDVYAVGCWFGANAAGCCAILWQLCLLCGGVFAHRLCYGVLLRNPIG